MTKVLVVDDDEILRAAMAEVLQAGGLQVTTASNVSEALRHIVAEKFDVLLSDLHMPGAGDGLTVISAMRHANPEAVTLLLSAQPRMEAATQAILMQVDEIFTKSMDLRTLVTVVKDRAATGPMSSRLVENVAQILERSVESTIDEWYRLVEKEEMLQSVPMTYQQRTGHLPLLFRELISRLRSSREIGIKGLPSTAAARHGAERCRAGYSAAMLVEESRMLQISILGTLQGNLASIDFNLLLIGVMRIGDEIDSQLSQAMASYQHEAAPKHALV